MLSVKNISKTLAAFTVREASFDVTEGEYFVLLGASGVGKTVLLEIIAGLLSPDTGQIFLNNRNITVERIQKRKIGLVYQDQALFPHLTVRRNLAYGVHRRKEAGRRVHQLVEELAREVGVSHLLDRTPETLSGGEAQRVALARALAREPLCLLLDEPISFLDVQSRSEIRALLRKIHRRGQTIVHVTHDYEEAISLGSRIAVMENGRIAQVGTPQEVFARPKSEFVARFVGIRNVFRGKLEQAKGGDVAEFVTDGPVFAILTDSGSGQGFVMFRSEDVTVSNARSQTSARNTFEGTVVDIEPAALGFHVLVDIGVKIWASITTGSAEVLGLCCEKKVWVSFKASALRFLGE